METHAMRKVEQTDVERREERERDADSAHNTVVLPTDLATSWTLVADAIRYPDWLVGAQAIREIDDEWPQTGSMFRHRIGWGPLSLIGSTSVRRAEPPRRLDLGAGMGPFGEALVSFRLSETPGGTRVSILEVPRRGLARAAWLAARGVVNGALWGRNQISLEALQELAAAVSAESPTPDRD